MALLVRQYIIKQISKAGKIVFLIGIAGGIISGFIKGMDLKNPRIKDLLKFNWGIFMFVFSLFFSLSMLLLIISYILELIKTINNKPSVKKSKRIMRDKEEEKSRNNEWKTMDEIMNNETDGNTETVEKEEKNWKMELNQKK